MTSNLTRTGEPKNRGSSGEMLDPRRWAEFPRVSQQASCHWGHHRHLKPIDVARIQLGGLFFLQGANHFEYLPYSVWFSLQESAIPSNFCPIHSFRDLFVACCARESKPRNSNFHKLAYGKLRIPVHPSLSTPSPLHPTSPVLAFPRRKHKSG